MSVAGRRTSCFLSSGVISPTSNRQVRHPGSENVQTKLLIRFGSMPPSLSHAPCLPVNLIPTKSKEARDMRLPPHRYRQCVIGMNEPLLHCNCQLVSSELGCMTDTPLIGRFNIARDRGEVDGRLPLPELCLSGRWRERCKSIC